LPLVACHAGERRLWGARRYDWLWPVRATHRAEPSGPLQNVHQPSKHQRPVSVIEPPLIAAK